MRFRPIGPLGIADGRATLGDPRAQHVWLGQDAIAARNGSEVRAVIAWDDITEARFEAKTARTRWNARGLDALVALFGLFGAGDDLFDAPEPGTLVVTTDGTQRSFEVGALRLGRVARGDAVTIQRVLNTLIEDPDSRQALRRRESGLHQLVSWRTD